jgi:hypothetical protein
MQSLAIRALRAVRGNPEPGGERMAAMGQSGERSPIPLSDLDFALTAQFVVAWAGETGEEKRLGWWRSDLVSEFGGEDLFRSLLPATWAWAALQAARETARRKDADMRRQQHDADQVLSLFSFGFEIDERIEERLQDLKRSGEAPESALPGLSIIKKGWSRPDFEDWVEGHGEADTAAEPIGRRLKGKLPAAFDQQVRRLVAGLAPFADSYPLPHFRRAT